MTAAIERVGAGASLEEIVFRAAEKRIGAAKAESWSSPSPPQRIGDIIGEQKILEVRAGDVLEPVARISVAWPSAAVSRIHAKEDGHARGQLA